MSSAPTGAPISGSLAERWVHPNAFAEYEEARSIVAPALSSAIQEALGRVPAGSDVLEIGAGAGALRRYGGETAQSFSWVESDQNPAFLALPRSRPADQLEVRLPEIPLEPASVDAVVGLGVLDTLETEVVAETMNNAERVLRAGGTLLHIMDLAPDMIAEIRNSAHEGVFPLPYSAEGELGLCYVDRQKIGQQIQSIDIKPQAVRVLMALIQNPEEYLPLANKTGILPHFGTIAVGEGFAVAKTPSWMKLFGVKLGKLAEASGLEPIANEYIEADGVKMRTMMPPTFRDADAVFRRFGAIGINPNPTIRIPNMVKVNANIHVFAAQKPSAETDTSSSANPS